MAESDSENDISGALAFKAVKKVLSGCVTKVLHQLKGSSKAAKRCAPTVAPDTELEHGLSKRRKHEVSRPCSSKTSNVPCSSAACPAPPFDSDSDFIDDYPKKKKIKKKLYPSSFLNRKKAIKATVNRKPIGKCSKGREITYERDIICLPKSFGNHNDLIELPNTKCKRKFLVRNKLVGKLKIVSSMDEDEIFYEIRSVFRKPMCGDESFRFKILQSCGGDTRCLMLPEVSKTYRYTAGAVAGRNSKTPVYILAEDPLKLIDTELLVNDDLSEEEGKRDLYEAKKLKQTETAADEGSIKSMPLVVSDSDLSSNEAPRTSDKKDSDTDSDLPPVLLSSNSKAPKASVRKSLKPNVLSECSSVIMKGNPAYCDFVDLVHVPDEFSDQNSPPTYSPLTPPDKSNQSVKELLHLQKVKVLPVDSSVYQRIVVRRKHLWEDVLRHFRRGIDFKKHIRITFVSEPGVDEGGPMREFLHLVMKAIACHNGLFCGEDYRRVPCQNLTALEKGIYKCIGQMIATSLVFGGPAPFFLATPIVQYMIHGLQKVKAAVDDVPDTHVRGKLKQADSVGVVQQLLDSDDFNFLYDVRISPGKDVSLARRDEIVNSLAKHFTVVVVKAQLDQIVEGLQAFDIYDLIRSHPSTVYHLFVMIPNPPSATDMIELFQQPAYSEGGSNAREKEEQIVMYFVQFIYMMEGEQPLKVKKQGQEEVLICTCTFETLLQFVTGAPNAPPCGYTPQPSIEFNEGQNLPRANTCSCTLYLPFPNDLPDYDLFAYNMVFGITNSFGFQTV